MHKSQASVLKDPQAAVTACVTGGLVEGSAALPLRCWFVLNVRWQMFAVRRAG